MRKYLLIIILLAWSGVDYLYAQKPTITVTIDQTEFCESGVAKISLTLGGLGPFDFGWEIDTDGDGEKNQWGDPEGYNTSPNYWTEKEWTFTGNGYFQLNYVYDENYPKANGVSGEFIDGNTGEIIEGGRIDIKIYSNPSPIIDPAPKTCRKEVIISASPGGDNTKIDWTYFSVSGSGAYNYKEDTEAKFSAGDIGEYTFIYTVENGACIEERTLLWTVTDQATPSAEFNLLDKRICSDETTSLEIVGDGANRYPLTLGFTDDKGNTYSEVLNTANESIPISANSSTTYTMNSLIDSEGCDASLAETLNLIVDSKPFPAAGVKDSPNCGSEKELLGQITDGNSMTWSVVAAEGSGLFIEDVNNKDSRVYVNYNDQYAYETYTLKLTELVIDNPTCIGEDEVEIELYKEPGDVSLGQDTTVYNEKQLIINTVGIADMPFYWTLSDGLSVDDGNPNQIVVSNLLKGDNKLICTVNNGECAEVSAEKLITVKGIYQTNGFSPNGDNTNDYFIIGGAQNVANNKLTVFDITGKVVFEANEFMVENNLDGWNGQKNDGKTEDGTYYYIFEGDNIEPVKSYLIIKGSKQ